MADLKQKRLAFAICDFLKDSVKSGAVKTDDAEGIELAIQCIGEAFGVNHSSTADDKEYSIKPATLQQIFNVFTATQEKNVASQPQSKGAEVKAEDQAKAEELKGAGNKAMAAKDFDGAIKFYSQAIDLDKRNAVFYANRAAAYSQIAKYDDAVSDAKKAIDVDATYSKAYGRLGQAYFCLGKLKEAKQACQDGLKLDSTNASMRQTLSAIEAKENEDAPVRSSPTPGAGAPGGGFDFASMMSNPNFMQMASQMMGNPQIASMMNNPAFAQMAQSVMSNPEALSGLMSDPNVANMLNQGGPPQ
ncbi:hypothetical protein DFS34DRAFT_602409 [Phlyctochytrium arcticum]|nr:hypothetical protein DFS34DRAFT_602409 [Phlyctochytrium arcticum]